MRFDRFIPTARLRPYVKRFAVSEQEHEAAYRVFPSPGMVMGFQYKGQLAGIKNGSEAKLATAGITGIAGSWQVFKNAPGTGTILVYFTPTGYAHFAPGPASDLFDLSVALYDVFEKSRLAETEEQLSMAATDRQRIDTVEQFLLSQLQDTREDKLIHEAVRLIAESKGTTRMKELTRQLFISQRPFEKRFKLVVGTTPGKFASIVRFNNVLDSFGKGASLIDICYGHNFFDQAHFIKDFRQFTGSTPGDFKLLS